MKKAKIKPAGGKKTTRKGKEGKETKRGGVEKFTQEQVVQAITESNGLLAGAARLLKCSRTTIYRYVEQYPAVKDACQEANEATKDFVENKLIDAIRANNITAIIFYLKTKAKDRGYVEKQVVDMTGTLEFNFDAWKKEAQKRLKAVEKLEQ